MNCRPVYCAGTTPAVLYASNYLKTKDIPIVHSPHWNTGHLLLDVPSFRPGSSLTENGNLDTLLSSLPQDITVWGGNLNHPSFEGLRTVDLLKDETYLVENAAITARCTVRLLAPMLADSWQNTPSLIIGWGRIGKQLAKLLQNQGCPVTVSTGSTQKLEQIRHLGYPVIHTSDLHTCLSGIKLLINTAPAPVLEAGCCDCLKVDLASQKGIAGEDVVWARGLPGIHAPEESGILIAETFLRLYQEADK